jgi:putative heme-binding domain-containing protein
LALATSAIRHGLIVIAILALPIIDSLASDPPRPVKVFILAGQSNMEGQAVVDLSGKDYNDGRGTLDSLLRDPDKRAALRHLERDESGSRWAVRNDVWCRYQREHGPLLAGPLTVGFSVYGDAHHFGPELQFGHVMGEYFDEQVLLIKTAWGGKSLYRDFRPPSSGGEVGPYYTKMIEQIREAVGRLKDDFPEYDDGGYEFAGFVWYHGWNDGVEPQTAVPQYEQNLANLISDLRSDLGTPELPVVVGELTGPWVDAPGEWATLRKAQAAVATRSEFVDSVRFVSTRDFVRNPEDSPNPSHGHHEFGNAETYFLVGDALAKGMLALVSGVPPVEAGDPSAAKDGSPAAADSDAANHAVDPNSLEAELRKMPVADLIRTIRGEGDAVRGATVFHQPLVACAQCHSVGNPLSSPVGPDLAKLGKDITDAMLIESVLEPSKVIREGYASVVVLTVDGRSLTGILTKQNQDGVAIRDPSFGTLTTVAAADIDEVRKSPVSIMPIGQIDRLASRQQFYDLMRYLIDIRDGGVERALELQPSAALIAYTVPEYEQRIDHAALISDWGDDSLRRGEAIYQRVCANCHGTRSQEGSLPTSLKFAEGKFKNGSDPLSMYRTLTHGFGLMPPQTWMVPSQKYDVIHYIRETYLRDNNPAEWKEVDRGYVAGLPSGDTRGPDPSTIEPWNAMDYGSSLTHTYEIPGRSHNFAYKGIAVRLDPGAGGVSRGRHWMIFDTDTMRVAAAWSADDGANNFIDWRGIQFNGEHQIHPSIVGKIAFSNPTGPGWADPENGSFRDDRQVEGRDGRRYGPLPHRWAKYRGLYHHDQNVIASYTVGGSEVLEMPSMAVVKGLDGLNAEPMFLRTFNIGPRNQDLEIQIADHQVDGARVVVADSETPNAVWYLPTDRSADVDGGSGDVAVDFDGQTYIEITDSAAFDVTDNDFTITARLRTDAGGTLFAIADPGPKWTPDGQTFFVRDGRLGFDIGWVGAVTTARKVNDCQWHDVAMTWRKSDHKVRLYVDGQLDAEGTLSAKDRLENGVARIGFTSPNFPSPHSFFRGDLDEVRFYQRCLSDDEDRLIETDANDSALVGRWTPGNSSAGRVPDISGNGHDASVRRGESPVASDAQPLLAGFLPANTPAAWNDNDGKLRLRIAAGDEPVAFTVWTLSHGDTVLNPLEKSSGVSSTEQSDETGIGVHRLEAAIDNPARNLVALTQGGRSRWSGVIRTKAQIGPDEGPFTVDVLTAPESNPWLAQTRFTGLDFSETGDIAICSWDGDVWWVETDTDTSELRWRRIATGLFQPLGLKIVDGKIHVTCRDQLVVLHDLNGDGEIDFYECLNSDHQVTEHFHEFAMGLQVDSEGNFYYAKSGRHALPAVVPQHGTLLKVSPDGAKTEILATGFRAANGVCLNPDGSLAVTDQEGFWIPKNRINWVTPDRSAGPKFYGNLLGYTDVTDTADTAMEPPLCWITNAFDRSPAELLWVDSDRWGQLNGSLLSLSYGYGKIFLVPHERVGGVMQGGMIELPLPTLATGVMRGRFNPGDGQLYLCGMFAWAGNATHPGALYRVRPTGRPAHLPIAIHAKESGMVLRFTEPLEPSTVGPDNVSVKRWTLKRTAGYGSDHHDETELRATSVSLSEDGKTVTIFLADPRPTWCMEIKYSFRSATGDPVAGVIHNTIHELAE